MNYLETLNDKAFVLGMATTDAGKETKVFQPTLLAELLNEARRRDGKGGVGVGDPIVTALSDSLIRELKDSLQRVTNLTFNSALPICKTVLKRLQQVINPDVPVAYQQYEINTVRFGGLWDTALVGEMAENGRTRPVDVVDASNLVKSIDDPDYSDLLALASTGLHEFDSELDSVFSKREENELRLLFIDVFNRGVFPSTSISDLLIEDNFNDWVLISRWANRLFEVRPSASRFDEAKYNSVLASIENRANQVIAGIDDYRKQTARVGRLIVRQRGKSIWVIQEPYSTFLASGGSPEAILAVALTNGRQTTTEDIKQQQAALEAQWERHVQIATETHNQKMVGRARHELHLILSLEVVKFYQESGDKAKEALALDKIKSLVNDLPNDFVRDAHRWVFDIVSKLMFSDTDVCILLNCLREAGDKYGGELAPEVIRAMATTNYVGDWLANLVHFTEHGFGVSSYSSLAPLPTEMATEALSGKQIAGIVVGVGVAAVIGFAAYKLLSKGKSVENKVATVAEKVSAALDKAITAAEERLKENVDRTIDGSVLAKDESIVNILAGLPYKVAEKIVKGEDISGYFNALSAAVDFSEALSKSAKNLVDATAVIKGNDSIESKVKAFVKNKKEATKDLHNAMEHVAKKLNVKVDSSIGPDDQDKIEKLIKDVVSAYGNREDNSPEKITALLNGNKVNLDKLLSLSKSYRKNFISVTLRKKNELEKIGNNANDIITDFRKEVRENNPELMEELESKNEGEEETAMLLGVIQVSMETCATIEAAFAMSAAKFAYKVAAHVRAE